MAGIEENRVFDKASLEELKEQAAALMECAKAVTEELKSEAEAIINIAGRIPAEAREASLSSSAVSLLVTLDTEPFDTMKTYLTQILDKLTSMVPAYDAAGSQVLGEVTASTVALKGMVGELTSLIGNGSLSLSLEEFSGKLEEFRVNLQEGMVTLVQKMELAMTFLKGMVLTSCYSKDPVNLSTGNFYYEKEDLKIRGLIPLIFKRHYNALDKSSGMLGHGWSCNHEIFLTVFKEKQDELLLHKGDGKEVIFQKKDGLWQDIYTGQEVITEFEEGYQYREGRFVFLFDRKGKVLSFMDNNGNSLCYTYDEMGRMDKVTLGKEEAFLRFSYKENDCLKEVADHTGRKLSFFYVEGRLAEVTDPENHVISYRYDESGRIRAIKNARGIISVRNDYDEEGRVVRQRFPDKGEMLYEYKDAENRTILTERNGGKIIYEQDNKLRNTAIIYSDCEERFTYDSMDHRTSYTDGNGNKTVYTYDEDGNLQKYTDALGNQTEYFYTKKKLTRIIRPDGSTVKLSYDEKGNIVCVENSDGGKTQYEYAANGKVQTIIRADGSRIEITFDHRGNITCLKNADGGIISYEYDLLNRVIRTEDIAGRAMRYQYDKRNHLIKVTRPDGQVREYTYNESGKIRSVKDYDGYSSYWDYNNIGKVEAMTDKLGRTTTFGYDKMWNPIWQQTQDGARITFRYDNRNRLCEVKNPEGGSMRYEYDYNGNLIRQQRGDGSVVSFTYDALNHRTSYTDAEGNVTEYFYDNMGNLVRTKDALGGIYTYIYDHRQHLVESINPMGVHTKYTYNVMGRLSETVDGAGRKTKYEYLQGGQLAAVFRANGTREYYHYDSMGRLKEKEDGQGYMLVYTYDCLDRVISIESNQGQKKKYVYDVMGNVIEMTDANGAKTHYAYNAAGQLTGVRDAMGGRASYWYDEQNRLIGMLQAGEGTEEAEYLDRDLEDAICHNRQNRNLHLTLYTRNAEGKIKEIEDALGYKEIYTYDVCGRIKEKKDRDGYVTTYSYDNMDHIKEVQYADGRSVRYSYDALAKLRLVEDWLGITRIENDAMGRNIQITDSQNRQIGYERGSMGERRSVIYPDGEKIFYEYDDALRLSAMKKEGADSSFEISYLYDEAGRLKEKRMPEGIKTCWHYNAEGFLQELRHEDPQGVLDCYKYVYDLMGNKTEIIRERRGLEAESGCYRYEYDALNRLTSVEQDGTAIRNYQYDFFGNRVEMENIIKDEKTVYTYNALNQLLSGEMVSSGIPSQLLECQYDCRGNMVKEITEGQLVHGYEYDVTNRLTRAWNKQEVEAVYQYNGMGQRTGRREGGKAENYILDFTKSYYNLLGIEGEDERTNFYWDGNVAAMERQIQGQEQPKLERSFYLQDELGSPLRILGDAPAVYGYDEFGNDLYQDFKMNDIPNPYDEQGTKQPFGYTGYRHDDVSGTYFAQAREYAPQNGRMDAEDIIQGSSGYIQSWNRYIYCWNNPLMFMDANGEYPYNLYERNRKIDMVDSWVKYHEVYPRLAFEQDYEETPLQEWMQTVKEVGKWYVENVDTYCTKTEEEIKATHRDTSLGRKYYTCDLSGNLCEVQVGDDCSSFVSACLAQAGYFDSDVDWRWYNSGAYLSNGRAADDMIKAGFVWYDSDELKPEMLQQGDILVVDGHIEIFDSFASNEQENEKAYTWGDVYKYEPAVKGATRNSILGMYEGIWRLENDETCME